MVAVQDRDAVACSAQDSALALPLGVKSVELFVPMLVRSPFSDQHKHTLIAIWLLPLALARRAARMANILHWLHRLPVYALTLFSAFMHAIPLLMVAMLSVDPPKKCFPTESIKSKHTTVTARARRTRCAHAQLAPTDFFDTCLSTDRLLPPPGRTQAAPTVAQALRERSQRPLKPPRPPMPRPCRWRAALPTASAASRQATLLPGPPPTLRRGRRPPTQRTPPSHRAQCARCGGGVHPSAALFVTLIRADPSRAISPQHCLHTHSPAAAIGAPPAPLAVLRAARGWSTHSLTAAEALATQWPHCWRAQTLPLLDCSYNCCGGCAARFPPGR